MLLNAEQLHFQFAPSKKVLDGVGFALEAGKVYALLGANGAGKTTLFNLLSGFLRPSAGSIRLNGTETTKRLPYQVNRLGVGRTFQGLRLAILTKKLRLLVNGVSEIEFALYLLHYTVCSKSENVQTKSNSFNQ